MNERSGIFVSVDGPNGVGKSTLVDAIVENLRQNAITVRLTKEVTETPIGMFIRNAHRQYRGKTLALLIAADRQNHVEQDIIPALGMHDVVISDRYVDSSLAFQWLDGVELAFIWKINAEFLKPDLSIAITAEAAVIESRMALRNSFDRFETAFTRDEEISSFKQAASFLEGKGFSVRRFNNVGVSVADAAAELSSEILCLCQSRRG